MSNTEIVLDAPSASGPPGIKFPAVGNSVKVGIVDVIDYQQRTMAGELKTFEDGNPMMGKRVVGVVLENDGGILTIDEKDKVVEEGDLVSFFCEGSRFFTWKDAKKDHGKVTVGDIMTWKFDREEAATQKGFNKRKVFIANLRPAGMSDGLVKSLCTQEYLKLHGLNDVTADAADEGESGQFKM